MMYWNGNVNVAMNIAIVADKALKHKINIYRYVYISGSDGALYAVPSACGAARGVRDHRSPYIPGAGGALQNPTTHSNIQRFICRTSIATDILLKLELPLKDRHILCLICGMTNTTSHHLLERTSVRHYRTDQLSPTKQQIIPQTSTTGTKHILTIKQAARCGVFAKGVLWFTISPHRISFNSSLTNPMITPPSTHTYTCCRRRVLFFQC